MIKFTFVKGIKFTLLEFNNGLLLSGSTLASTKLDLVFLSSFSLIKLLEDSWSEFPPAISIKCTLKFATLCKRKM